MAGRGTINKVILIGRLGNDAELRYTQTQVPVASFNLATNEVWRDQNGQMAERTDWHRIIAWRKLAEFAGNYMRKGTLAYIEGKLQTRTVDSTKHPGEKQYFTEVVADQIQLIGPKADRTVEVPPIPEENHSPSTPSSITDFPDSPMVQDEVDDLPF